MTTKWINCRKCGADLVEDEDEICFACGTPVKGGSNDDDDEDSDD